MPGYFHSSHNEISPRMQGSDLRGILGSITGMSVCILVMLLCSLCRIGSFSITLQLFTGMVIGWFYRLFHGRRSKTAAYVTVGICTVLVCALWVVLLSLSPAVVVQGHLTTADLVQRWSMIWELLLLCVGLGLVGFFFTRRSLLAYADWKRGPWHVAYAGGNGYSCNLLPEKLPAIDPPAYFAVHSRFAPGTRIIVEGSPDPESAESSVLQRQFVLRMRRSTRIGFAVNGCFMLLLGLVLFLLTDISALTMADRCALVFLELAEAGMGIVFLRMGKVSRVEVNGEQMRVVSRFGRAAEFSVRDVSSVSRSPGWIVLYDREFKALAKVDSYLEDLDRLNHYPVRNIGIK